MKRNTKLIFLGVVVLVYLLIWFLPDREKKNTVKTLPAINNVDEVEIQMPLKDDESNNNSRVVITLLKDEGSVAGWVVSTNKYLPEEMKVRKLVEMFTGELGLEVVSLSRAYESYDVDEKRAMRILLKEKGKLMRELRLGKSGNRYKTRYVVIDEDPIIYVSLFPAGDTVADIESEDDFRLKLAFLYEPGNLSTVVFTPAEGSENTLRKELVKTNAEDKEKVVPERSWVSSTGETYTVKTLPKALVTLQNVNARAFFNYNNSKSLLEEGAVATYTFTYEDGTTSAVTIYGRAEEGYPLLVDGNDQGYYIPFNDGDDLLKGF